MILPKYDNLPELVKQYLCYITTIKNHSPKTANAYATDLRNFFKFFKIHKKLVDKKTNFKQIDISDINIELIKTITLVDVYEYLNFAMINHNSAKSRARKISSIRGFFKYLTINLNVLKQNPIKNLELPSLKKTLPKYLSVEESVKLLNIQAISDSKTRYRDYCILTLFLNCGMRLSELERINLDDIKTKDSSLKLLGKGNKERIVFLNEACQLAISDYLKLERQNLKRIQNKKALFLSQKTGKRLCARQIENVVGNALKRAGLSNMGYSPHKLRHTAATLLYQYGKVDILILKELLGHANVGTTEIYTHVSDEILKNAVLKNPLAKQKINGNEEE